jgi:hypothetical protein
MLLLPSLSLMYYYIAASFMGSYSLRFKIKVTFGYKLRYKIKFMIGEISLKLRQTNWNVAKNKVNVVLDELPSQITVYTCLTIDIWT